MSGVPTSFDTFYNPIVDMHEEYKNEIALADELAVHYIGDDDLKPSHILNILANIDVNEIRNHGARLHHRAQEVYATLQDSSFKELLSNSWQGGDADAFEDYICGGGGHRGLDLYFEEVKAKTESHSMALINLGEEVAELLSTANTELISILVDVKNGVYEAEANGWGGALKNVLNGGSALITACAAIPGLGWLVSAVLLIVGTLLSYIVAQIDEAVKTENAARSLMSDLESVAAGTDPDLPSAQRDDLGVTDW
ncbi:hypothetical protein [Glycomyces sp. NRRL B-16210]|uniref:hypothetical protein n=1 Tax=Glycomyces sp. NRRL B-16210 TaxID=1463821 RepID=UPI0004C1B15A|nr:hypothetical protein [Glycomyces sp. NRRL B-16210]